jgi:hypothetical protein
MRKLTCSLLLASLIIVQVCFAQTSKPTDDCLWRLDGSSRATVKNRKPPQRAYHVHKRGGHITINQWYELVFPFSCRAPEMRDISEDQPIPKIETVRVTIKGYLIEAKFEWRNTTSTPRSAPTKMGYPHVIVEVPAQIKDRFLTSCGKLQMNPHREPIVLKKPSSICWPSTDQTPADLWKSLDRRLRSANKISWPSRIFSQGEGTRTLHNSS